MICTVSNSLAMAPRNTFFAAAPVVRSISFVGRRFLETGRETSNGTDRHFGTMEEAPWEMLTGLIDLQHVEARYQVHG